MRIILTVTSLMPSYGGPAFSVSLLAKSLAESGLRIGLWAADQSAQVTPMLTRDTPVVRLTGTVTEALNSFGKVDVLHDNGLWLLHNHRISTLAQHRRLPRIVSPRGMLEPWAMNYKRWKKSMAWRLYQRRDLARASCLHTTAEQETKSVWKLGLNVPVCMVPNGVELPFIEFGPTRTATNASDSKVALYIGRLHPKKGLPMLIEAWARTRPEGWVLRIAGPDEDGHQAELQELISANELNGIVTFLGPIDGAKKSSSFFGADLFVLPTKSENFGLVVAEALAHGLPVLTTTAAPWAILPDSGCGWCVEPSVDGLAGGLSAVTSCKTNTLRQMGTRGRKVVATNYEHKEVTRMIVAMYEAVLAGNGVTKGAGAP